MLPGHPLRNRQKTLKLPPLVPPFSSKLVAMYNADVWVWPRQSLDLSPCKLLHEFQFGGMVSAKQLSEDSDVQKRLQTELSVWGISLALKEFSCFDFELDRVTTILEQGLRSGSPS